jgi:hypothetical protein
MVVINRHTHRESMLRLLVRGLKRFLVSLLQPAVRVRRGQPAHVRWSVALALQGMGLVLGVLRRDGPSPALKRGDVSWAEGQPGARCPDPWHPLT